MQKIDEIVLGYIKKNKSSNTEETFIENKLDNQETAQKILDNLVNSGLIEQTTLASVGTPSRYQLTRKGEMALNKIEE